MTRFTVHGECITNEDDIKVALYSVVVITAHKGMETHFVLAQDEEKASDMARCAMGVADYNLPDKLKDTIKTIVTNLPLTIQGWGKNKY